MRIFEKKKKQTYVNLTSLIDILFLLIIFFAVSTHFPDQKGLSFKLPISQSGKNASTSEKLVITIREEASVFINGSAFSWKELEEFVQLKKFQGQSAVLNIDQKIQHGTVIRLVDILKKNGFEKIIFGTRSSSS